MYDVILLGANGQLGSDCRQVFTAKGINYLSLSRHEIDVLTGGWQPQLAKAATNCKLIVNCIAYTNVDKAEDDVAAAFAINAIFPYHLAKFCHERQITLVHFSTDYVFSGADAAGYTENSVANPQNIYGLSKYAGDIAIQEYHDRYFIFRVAALFGKVGASGKGGNFITTMQRLAAERDTITVIADQITNPTATLDVARCVCRFIQQELWNTPFACGTLEHDMYAYDTPGYGVYNCVSSNSCSWFEFARQIFILSNLNPAKVLPINYADYQFKVKRPQYSVLTTDKLAKFYLMPTWETSLAEYFRVILCD